MNGNVPSCKATALCIPRQQRRYGLLGRTAALLLACMVLATPHWALAAITATQDLNASWQDDGTNGFLPATGTAAIGIDDPEGLYINSTSSAQSMTFTAGEGLEAFDLTSFTVQNYLDSTAAIQLTFTAVKQAGGTVTTTVSADVAAKGFHTFTGFGSFTAITGFTVQVDLGVSFNVTMTEFTIANMLTGNIPPVLGGLADVGFQENTVNATPQPFATAATVTDEDSADFAGGNITVGYTSGGSAEDQLGVGNHGNITVAGSNIYHGASLIGTWSGGDNGSNLTIALNANATPPRVQDLLRALTYGNSSDEPTSYRTVSVVVSDGDGGSSTAATMKIAVTGEADGSLALPTLTQNVDATWRDHLNNGFVVTGTDGVGGDAAALWANSGAVTVSLEIGSAEAFAGGQFDLTGITWDVASAGVTMDVTLIGHRGDGSTVSTSGTVTLSGGVVNVTGISYAGLTEIVSFEIVSTHPSSGNGNNVGIDAFTIANPAEYVGNTAPVLSGLSDVSFQENTANAAHQPISNTLSVSDPDSADFAGGTITVSFTSGGSSQDQLSVTDAGNITVSGANIYHGASLIGTWSGGSNGGNLTIALNAAATPALTTDLLRAIAYGNSSDEPLSYRTVAVTMSDGDGGTSNLLSARIAVVGEHEGTPEAPLSQDLNLTTWPDHLNNGFSAAISGPGTLSGNGVSLWIGGGTSGTSAMVFSAAEQLTGGIFDLTALSFDIYPTDSSQTYTVLLTGFNGASVIATTEVTGANNAAFNAIPLHEMIGITSFSLKVTSTADVSGVGLDSFTIANPRAAGAAPTDITLDSASVNQSGGINAVVGTLSTTDPDAGDSHSYTLVSGAGDTDNDLFNISGDSLRANDAAALAAGSYSVRVRTTDSSNWTYDEAFTITVVDDVAPLFQNGTPTLGGTTATTTTLTVRLNETGTAYYVAVADGAGAPSASQVKAGQDSSGAAAFKSGTIAAGTAGADFSTDITGLALATAYDIYVIAEDAAATPNMQAVASQRDLTTLKGTPTVTSWPSAGTITYGQALAASVLSGGAASTDGSFAYTDPAQILGAGTHGAVAVTFTPTDALHYNTVAGTVAVTVDKAVPVVSTWPAASAISYGQTLSSSVLSGGAAVPGGSFAFTDPAQLLDGGSHTVAVTFTPTDGTNYLNVEGSVTVTVNQATPTVTAWPTAAPLTYGQPLSAATLTGGTASVAGNFAFVDPTQELAAGSHAAVAVTFTPTDTVNYGTVDGSVAVTVDKATPTVTTWPTASRIDNGAPLSTSTLSGGAASVAGSFAFTDDTQTPPPGLQTVDVTFTPTDAANYLPVAGTVTVAVGAYQVTFDIGGGTHTGGGALIQTVAHGDAATAPTVTPPVGWTFTGWDKAFNTVTSDLAVVAQYSRRQYTVTATAGSGGSISPASQTVSHGNAASFSVTPAQPGQHIEVTGCGASLNGTTVTTAAITGDCTLVVSFGTALAVTDADGQNYGGGEVGRGTPHTFRLKNGSGSYAVSATLVRGGQRSLLDGNGIAAVLTDNGDGSYTFSGNGSGRYEFNFMDTASGQQVTLTFIIHPRLGFASVAQPGTAGQRVQAVLLLDDLPVNYPVTIPYTVQGAEWADGLEPAGTVGIGTAPFTSVALQFTPNSDSGEIVLTLREDGLHNAHLGSLSSHRVTLAAAGSVPLLATLTATQNGRQDSVVTSGGGMVTLQVIPADTGYYYDWSGSAVALGIHDQHAATVSVDPSVLAGNYRAQVAVTETGAAGRTATAKVLLRVTSAIPAGYNAFYDTTYASEPHRLIICPAGGMSRVEACPETGAAMYLQTLDGYTLRLGQMSAQASFEHDEFGLALTSDDFRDENGVPPLNAADNGYLHLGYMVDFELSGMDHPGQSVPVVIPLPPGQTIPADAVWRKYMGTQGWRNFVENAANTLHSAPQDASGACPWAGAEEWTAGLSEGDSCVRLTLEDGGPNDLDGRADGVIRDPGTLAVETALEQPAQKSGGGAFGGLFLLLLAIARRMAGNPRRFLGCGGHSGQLSRHTAQV